MKTRVTATVRLTLSLLVILCAMASCAREYRIEQQSYVAALQLARAVGIQHVAVPATPIVDGAPARHTVYVRAAALELLSPPVAMRYYHPPLLARAPNTPLQKEAGRALLILGALGWAGFATALGYDLIPQCRSGEACDHIPLIMLAGPPLGLVGLLTIPGIVLTVLGHRPPSEVSASSSDQRYVAPPIIAAP